MLENMWESKENIILGFILILFLGGVGFAVYMSIVAPSSIENICINNHNYIYVNYKNNGDKSGSFYALDVDDNGKPIKCKNSLVKTR